MSFNEETKELNEIGFLELDDVTDEDNFLWKINSAQNNLTHEIKNTHLKIISYVGQHFEQLLTTEENFRKKFTKNSTIY